MELALRNPLCQSRAYGLCSQSFLTIFSLSHLCYPWFSAAHRLRAPSMSSASVFRRCLGAA
ncbi:MAG: hypothetical protein WCB27_11265, partial [Thermoguttaceae bacterium]